MPPHEDEYLTEEEVADMFGVTVHGVRKWRQKGQITFIKIGKTVRFRRTDVDEFIISHTKEKVVA